MVTHKNLRASIQSHRPLGLLSAVFLGVWGFTAIADDAPPSAVRSFHLDGPVARVFPLFTALGERSWAQGWDPILLSGREERGTAFRTVSGGRETTWIVTDYRPAEGRVSYARLAQHLNIGLVDVVCSAVPGGGTEVSVRYTLTGLSPQGQTLVREFLEPEHYSRMIEEWRVATSTALAANK